MHAYNISSLVRVTLDSGLSEEGRVAVNLDAKLLLGHLLHLRLQPVLPAPIAAGEALLEARPPERPLDDPQGEAEECRVVAVAQPALDADICQRAGPGELGVPLGRPLVSALSEAGHTAAVMLMRSLGDPSSWLLACSMRWQRPTKMSSPGVSNASKGGRTQKKKGGNARGISCSLSSSALNCALTSIWISYSVFGGGGGPCRGFFLTCVGLRKMALANLRSALRVLR